MALLFFARISGTLRLSWYSREVALLVNNLAVQAVADASHGKFKTARGAAFAVYYNQDVVE